MATLNSTIMGCVTKRYFGYNRFFLTEPGVLESRETYVRELTLLVSNKVQLGSVIGPFSTLH